MKTGWQLTGVDADKFKGLGKWEASAPLLEVLMAMDSEVVNMNWIKRLFKAIWNYAFVHEYYDTDGNRSDRKRRAR